MWNLENAISMGNNFSSISSPRFPPFSAARKEVNSANVVADGFVISTEISDENLLGRIRQVRQQFGLNELARASRVSSRHISRILKGEVVPSFEIVLKLHSGVRFLQQDSHEQAALIAKVRNECAISGLRKLANSVGIDPANLSHILNGSRPLGINMRTKLEAALG